MRRSFALTLARREGRAGIRKLGIHIGSIALGVAALVAIHSFRADVARSIEQESRSILGADLRLQSRAPMGDSVLTVVDSLIDVGAESARVVDLPSMVLSERSQVARLMQVRALEPGFPFYGSVVTDPPASWPPRAGSGSVLVDDPVLLQLDARIGDTVQLGTGRYEIAGTVSGLPTDIGIQAAVGPRVYLPLDDLAATGLLGFGSLAQHQIFVRLPEGSDADAIEDTYRSRWRSASTFATTAREQADDLTEGVQILSRFLGLVGLAALLLGGIGVASAIHVYVKEKLTSVAVLRCIGATQGVVFRAYLIQAAFLGLLGSSLGVIIGLVVQRFLPGAVGSMLPVTIQTVLNPAAILVGLGLGIWVSTIFALRPMLAVRDVSPLQALRKDFEPPRARFQASRIAATAALLASLVMLCVIEAPTPGLGAGFAVGLGITLGLLWLVAGALVRATRRFFPERASYPVRQGIANLFRPGNQTVTVTLGLGFGVFVLGTMVFLQVSLGSLLSIDAGGQRPNLVMFDVLRSQRDSVLAAVAQVSEGDPEVVPIVTSRIAAINGRSSSELTADSSDARPARWAVRRAYRNTYRGDLAVDEVVVEGDWWESAPAVAALETGEPVARISIEQDVAESLRVGLGDRITWDIQGSEVTSEIVSVRTVNWGRFQPNFYVVFEPGSLDEVPQTVIAFARVPDEAERAALQRDLLAAFPNVSSLDVARVQEVLDRILATIGGAVRLLAGISVIGGVFVLIGALATSRFQRMRESALLKTLGAQRTHILRIFFTEYLALGALAAAAGLALSAAGAWALLRWVFDASLVFSVPAAVVLVVLVVSLTVVVGMAGSRTVLTRTPLATIRDSI